MSFKNKKNYKFEYDVFQKFIKEKKFNFYEILILTYKSIFSLIEGLIRNIPGGIGFKIRYYYYKLVCKKIGKNVLIDIGVILNGPANISIDDYTWIDSYSIINAMLGEIRIGKRVHLAPFVNIGVREEIIIEDFVAVGASSKIYSNSQVAIKGKRMSGPMIPEEEKAFYAAPVHLKKDSFVGANSIIMPGVVLGDGAIVSANSLVIKSVPAWTVVMGTPAKKITERQKLI